jgi:hypothetical protein
LLKAGGGIKRTSGPGELAANDMQHAEQGFAAFQVDDGKHNIPLLSCDTIWLLRFEDGMYYCIQNYKRPDVVFLPVPLELCSNISIGF